jgi:cyclase
VHDEQGSEPELVEVGDGVHAYLQPDGGWCLNNAGVIVGGRTVAVVDTAATVARARLLRDQVARVAPTPPAYVINTHFHGDHTFGNHEFEPAAIIAQERTRADMIAAGLHLTGMWPDVDWGEPTLSPPTVLFTGRMVLHLGETRVELLDVGPAHTMCDTVVWLPEQKVLFTGDVVMSGVTPFVPMGTVTGSLAALDRLRALGAETVVTGHGVLAGPEVFDEMSGYLHWLLRVARDGMAAGLSPLAAGRDVKLGDYADWLDSARLVPNLHRAYADEAGTPAGTGVDLITAFGEMIDYHGGPLPCHA